MTIQEAAARLRRGETSCVQLLEAAHARIAELDDHLNAFISVIDQPAAAQAQLLDDELARGRDRGPLHGIPIAIKDNLATRGIRTTMGSRLFENWIPDYSAAAVQRLEEAGAILVGKANLHELAYGITSSNPHFGTVRNPHDPSRIPGGSSGGSAVAVATGMALGALGTDTGGSVRIPAAFCGVCGLKPTYGFVDRAGCFPLGLSLDHVGPLAATVGDLVFLMRALVPNAEFPLEPAPLKGLRIGWHEDFFLSNVEPAVRSAALNALQSLAQAGAQIVSLPLPSMAEVNTVARLILLAEASAVLERYMDRREQIGKDVRLLLEQGRALPAVDYINAQRARARLADQFAACFSSMDALLTPTTPCAAPKIGQRTLTLDGREEDVRLASTRFVRGFNLLGYPALALPWGADAQGLPLSLQLIGRPGADAQLLRLGLAIEQLRSELLSAGGPSAG
jgi:aspartyl-tRNA(Asn)/glutamyl-tRNA(Gln) amidotransferase subunit A